MLFLCLLSNRKGGVNKTCVGHTGDSFSSQEQAGVFGSAGTQLSVVGAARQPSPALLWLPEAPVLQFEFVFLTQSVHVWGTVQCLLLCCSLLHG